MLFSQRDFFRDYIVEWIAAFFERKGTLELSTYIFWFMPRLNLKKCHHSPHTLEVPFIYILRLQALFIFLLQRSDITTIT